MSELSESVSATSAPALSSSQTSAQILTVALLRNARYEELEARLSSVQSDFEAGRLSEVQLEKVFAEFAVPDAGLEEALSAWTEAYPRSYPAHLAMGRWLLSRTWEFRGGTTFDQVSDRGRRGMAYYLGQAQGCSAFATTLSAQPLAAQLLQSDVERTSGNTLTLEDVRTGRFPDWYLQGVEQNPHSYLLRSSMLRALRTEWGGSDEMMLTYVQGVEGQLSGAQRQRLWAQYHAQLTHYALHFSKNDEQAITHARMAAELHPSGSQILLVAAALLPAKVGGGRPARTAALEQVMDYLERTPEAQLSFNTAAALMRMDTSGDLKLTPRLLALLTRLLSEGDDEAGQALGILAVSHKQEGPDPVAVLTQLMDTGHSRAASILVAYHAAKPSDERAMEQALLRGADLGNPDCATEVYKFWGRLQPKYKLQDREKYRYLLLAADSGSNEARAELAVGLRRGTLELGDDGKLRPYAGAPLQESLDYAKHLLERAEHEGYGPAKRLLREAKPEHWQQGSKQAVGYAETKQGGAPRSRWSAYLWGLLILGLLRAVASYFGHHS